MAGQSTATARSRTDAVRSRFSREWLVSLGQRAATAFLLIPLVVGIVWFGGWVAFACAIVVAGLGLLELHRMLVHQGKHPILLFSAALGVVFLVAAMLPGSRAMVLGIGVSAAIVLSFGWLMLDRKVTLQGALTDWALTLAMPLYLCWPLAFFLVLRGNEVGFQPAGFWWTLTTLFSVWAFDTFAFFTGRFFGKHHMAPGISPKKTWEGAAGGLVFAMIAVALFTLPLHVAWYHIILLGLLVSAAATVGDLAESLIKRDLGTKDSGTIMPGHGGLLDRVDSLLFAVMVVYFYAAFLGSVPHL